MLGRRGRLTVMPPSPRRHAVASTNAKDRNEKKTPARKRQPGKKRDRSTEITAARDKRRRDREELRRLRGLEQAWLQKERDMKEEILGLIAENTELKSERFALEARLELSEAARLRPHRGRGSSRARR